MKNKKAIGGLTVFLMIMGVLAIVGTGLYFSGVLNGDDTVNVISEQGCNTKPTVSLSMFNALQGGAGVVISTNNTLVNGEYTGGALPTELKKGDVVKLMPQASGYITTTLPEKTLGCEGNLFTGKIYQYGAGVLKVFNDEGNLMTDSATTGAVNQSGSASQITVKLDIASLPLKSTGKTLVVIEGSNTTETKDITMSGDGAEKVTTLPSFYSVAGAGSIAQAYTIPALTNGAVKDYYITLSPEASQKFGNTDSNQSVYITLYALQDAVDIDGKFLTDVWQKSDGTNTTIADYDYDFVIAGSN